MRWKRVLGNSTKKSLKKIKMSIYKGSMTYTVQLFMSVLIVKVFCCFQFGRMLCWVALNKEAAFNFKPGSAV